MAEPKVSSKLVVLHHKGPEADVNVIEDGHQATVIGVGCPRLKMLENEKDEDVNE